MSLIVDHVALDEFLAKPDGPVHTALTRLAVKVETEAKRLVNVDTGRLRSSITHIVGDDEKGPVAYVGSNVAYAVYQELEPGDPFPGGGTRVRAGGSAFLRPALHSLRNG